MADTAVPDEAGIVTKLSPRSVPETVTRLTDMLAAKGITVFAVIDQTAAARAVGLELRATTLVIFGNPAGGTPVMAAVPLAALILGERLTATGIAGAALLAIAVLRTGRESGMASGGDERVRERIDDGELGG